MKLFKFYNTDDPGDAISKATSLEELEKIDVSTEPEKAPVEDTAAVTSEETEIKTEEVKKEETVQSTEKTEEAPKPEEVAPEKDTVKTDTLVLSDEVLSKMPEDKKRVLEKYKGKTFDEALEALYNSQIQIGKLASNRAREQKEQLFKPTPAAVPESAEYRDKLILGRVRDILPKEVELPKTLDLKSPEFREWYRDLNVDYPLEAREFLDSLKNESKAVDEAINQAKYVEQNYEKIITGQQNEAINAINSFFKEKIGIDLKDYGYDFTPDEKGDVTLINKLLFNDDGEDKNLVEYVFGRTPLLKPDAIATKFVQHELADILKKKEEKLLEQTRREAYKKINKEPEKLDPSFGDKTQQKKGITELDIDKASTLEELAEIEAKLRSLK
jgi:hypothetical protein